MQSSYLTPRAVVRPAGTKGDGVFAAEPIAAGETIAVFGGHVCTRRQLETLPPRRIAHSIQIDDDLYMVGAIADEPADFVNHSCEPNAGISGNVIVVAMVDIAEGDEICFDYAMSDADDYDEFRCACATSTCRGTVRGSDWRLPELQQRYAGWFSAYLQRRMR